jgi:hypothetical protein
MQVEKAVSCGLQQYFQGIWPRPDGAHWVAKKFWAAALFDNDARFPGDNPNSRIVEDLRPHVVFFHQLQRRTIESYLPYSILCRFDTTSAFKRKIDALFRLNDDQRRHYNMKRGFRFGEETSPSKTAYLAAPDDIVDRREKQLYSGVPDADWHELAAGFGRGLSAIYAEEEHRQPSKISQLWTQWIGRRLGNC